MTRERELLYLLNKGMINLGRNYKTKGFGLGAAKWGEVIRKYTGGGGGLAESKGYFSKFVQAQVGVRSSLGG